MNIDRVMYWAMPNGLYGFSAFAKGNEAVPDLKKNDLTQMELARYLGLGLAKRIAVRDNATEKVGETQYGEISGLELSIDHVGTGYSVNAAPKDYMVSWDIQVSADDPMEAALQAYGIQLDPESVVTVFRVERADRLAPPQMIDVNPDPSSNADPCEVSMPVAEDAAPVNLLELTRDLYGSADVAIDPDAKMSINQNGTWVQAWVRVSEDELATLSPESITHAAPGPR